MPLWGPGTAPADLETLPDATKKIPPRIEISHSNPEGTAFAGQGYKIFFENGYLIRGKPDGNGLARQENVPKPAQRVEYTPRSPLAEALWAA